MAIQDVGGGPRQIWGLLQCPSGSDLEEPKCLLYSHVQILAPSQCPSVKFWSSLAEANLSACGLHTHNSASVYHHHLENIHRDDRKFYHSYHFQYGPFEC